MCFWIEKLVQAGVWRLKSMRLLSLRVGLIRVLGKGALFLLSSLTLSLICLMFWLGELRKIKIIIIMGAIPYLVNDGMSILQYANVTILLMDHSLEQAKNSIGSIGICAKTCMGRYNQLYTNSLAIASDEVTRSCTTSRTCNKCCLVFCNTLIQNSFKFQPTVGGSTHT